MMKSDSQTMELLAPAGSYESLVAAVNAGADAVYMGGPLFGARAYADNPAGEQFFAALDYAHLRGCRVYLTVNTLLKERELQEQLYAYLEPIYRQGVDAVIVQDMGVLAFIREHFPDLPLHASTQMAVSGPAGARLLKSRGVRRLVLPRELSLAEMKALGEEGGVETEVFVHGALCYCYSGRCLMSSFLGGRSGNRGRCAQPCRMPGEEGRMLNMRDLCGIHQLPDLQAAGVTSLKIEGRMKSPVYTAGVTAIYRKYLDLLAEGRFCVSREDQQALSDLFDRGGFTDGYYRRHNGPDMLDTGPKKTHVSLPEADREKWQQAFGSEQPLPVTGSLLCRSGAPLSLSLQREKTRIHVAGAEVQAAEKQPLSEEKLRQQMQKTGGSNFVFSVLDVETAGDAWLPLGEVNALRRKGMEELEKALLEPFRRPAPLPYERRAIAPAAPKSPASYPDLPLSVLADDPALFDMLCQSRAQRLMLSADYVGPEALKAYADQAHAAGKELYYALPHIFRQAMRDALEKEEALRQLREAGLDGVLIRSLEEAGFWQEQHLPGQRLFDACLYSWNRAAEEEMAALGAQALTLPLEVHEKDLAALGPASLPREQLIYGRLPLMLSAQCLYKTRGRCLKAAGCPALTHPAAEPLKDRTGAAHPGQARCRYCYSVLYNGVPLYLADQPLYGDSLRLHFTTESVGEAEAVLRHIETGLAAANPAALKPLEAEAFTRGNYRKGVE